MMTEEDNRFYYVFSQYSGKSNVHIIFLKKLDSLQLISIASSLLHAGMSIFNKVTFLVLLLEFLENINSGGKRR